MGSQAPSTVTNSNATATDFDLTTRFGHGSPLANYAPGAVNGGASRGAGLLHAAKMTVPQAAKALGVGETKMREIVSKGGIPVLKVLGKTLLLEKDLEEYLRSGYGRIVPVQNRTGRLPPCRST